MFDCTPEWCFLVKSIVTLSKFIFQRKKLFKEVIILLSGIEGAVQLHPYIPSNSPVKLKMWRYRNYHQVTRNTFKILHGYNYACTTCCLKVRSMIFDHLM